MKFELYMTSPEQEFSQQLVQDSSGADMDISGEPMPKEQWLRLWDRNWIRTWYRWIRWDRWIRWFRWFRWIRWVPPWEIVQKGEELGKIEPIITRLLLRREKKGFLAMDSLTSRVLKLDEQAGKLVQLVQDGVSVEEAAKQLDIKKAELDEFLNFLKQHDVSTEM